jgi:UDPglucose--hexose-1-phosphate uridylyltransferase
VLERLDRLFRAPAPYMLWIHQRPFDGADWPGARVHGEIISPWRAPGVPRYVAAGELGSGVWFNPVAPEAAARALREAR